MNSLYQKGRTIRSLKEYFAPYFLKMTKPTAIKYFMIALAFIALQGVQSIRFMHHWFISKFSPVSLNALYHFFSYSKLSLKELESVTVEIALSAQPQEMKEYPIFLLFDDTVQAKFGCHFENFAKIFDHARHNNNKYLDGHCFVALSLALPMKIKEDGTLDYLIVPIAYRQWSKGANKLKIAASLVEQTVTTIPNNIQVILLCDSWYPKGDVLKVVNKISNLEIIANVRIDTCLFDLPKRTGKRGRPAKRGRKLNYKQDIELKEYGSYMIGARRVLTNLFGEKVVYAMLTSKNPSSHRLFISTVAPEDIQMAESHVKDELYPETEISGEDKRSLLPLFLYRFRWNIEVQFYLQKTFWSFGDYMIRSRKGVETYLHMLNSAFSCMVLLPYINKSFAVLQEESIQTRKLVIGQRISNELFFYGFVGKLETLKNKLPIFKAFDDFNSEQECA